jgi:hypothetical protein
VIITGAAHMRRHLAIAATLSLALLAGCQADYSADVHNNTPQPVFVQIFKKGQGTLGVNKRLGPGDRAFIGTVRNAQKKGAYMAVDTLSNPGRPLTVDLMPGATFFELQQDGTSPQSPLRLIEKR